MDVLSPGNRGTRTTASQHRAIPAKRLSTLPVRDTATINFLSATVRDRLYTRPGSNIAYATVARRQLLPPNPQFKSIAADATLGYSWYPSPQKANG